MAAIVSPEKRNLISLAGIPAAIAWGGTSLVTTQACPTAEPSPMVIPGMMIARAPIQTSFPSTIGPLFRRYAMVDLV